MKAGLVIGGLGALIGIGAAFYASPIMAGIMLVILVVSLMPFRSVFKNILGKSKLLKEGARGVARVLQISDTGVTVNNSPQVGLQLEVTPQDGLPFTTETRIIVNRLQVHLYQPGMMLNVRYDPQDKSQIAVESIGGSGMAAAPYGGGKVAALYGGGMPGAYPSATVHPAMNQTQALQLVQDAQTQAQRLNQIGRPAMAIVTAFTPLGINVNGDNPAATLTVKVMPPDGAPFDSKIHGVFGASGLHKYQPGKEISVKYDPVDTNTVAIDYQKAQVSQT